MADTETVEEANPRAIIGGNQPPLAERLPADYESIVSKVGLILEGAIERTPAITDEALAKRASDFLGQIDSWKKHVETKFEAEKEPWRVGGRIVDTFFNELRARLNRADSAVRDKLSLYLRQKADRERQARLDAEAAARESAEAIRKQAAAAEQAAQPQQASDLKIAASALETRADEHKAAAAAPVHRVGIVRGDLGTTSQLRDNWVAEGLDRATLDLEKLRPYFRNADLEYAVKEAIKKGTRPAADADGNLVQPIAGVIIVNRPTAARRG